MEKKTVFLYGINGTYNYGCEAMVRSISARIKREWLDTDVIYKTYSFEYDKNRLRDCDTVQVSELEVHARKKTLSHKCQRAIKFVKKNLHMANNEDHLPYNAKWLKNCDYLIIIGGDVFDLLPGQERSYDNERIWASKVAKENGAKVILWGISVGNFEKNKYAKQILIDFFVNDVDIALIRDQKSLDYLAANGVKNAHLIADPAFMLRERQTTVTADCSPKVLGINLSPLANRYMGMSKTQSEWQQIWADRISEISKRYNYDKIVLIPHVVAKTNPGDDDFSYLCEMSQLLKEKDIDVTVAPADLGFMGVKKYLTQCNVVMSARMHCSINAITCGVPTLFLSYSPKSSGMCEFVYGSSSYVLSMKDCVDGVKFDVLDQFDAAGDNIRLFLERRNSELCKMANDAMLYLKNQ